MGYFEDDLWRLFHPKARRREVVTEERRRDIPKTDWGWCERHDRAKTSGAGCGECARENGQRGAAKRFGEKPAECAKHHLPLTHYRKCAECMREKERVRVRRKVLKG